MRFQIVFHGPFRVAAGTSRPGVDVAVDVRSLLPESSLKGVMRSAAVDLGVSGALINEVFGTPAMASPWAWQPPEFTEPAEVTRRARVQITAASGTVAPGALLFADEVWTSGAQFTIEQLDVTDETTTRRHQCVLALAARGVRSLGATRNRGLGWVTITALDPPPDFANVAELRKVAELS